MKKILRAGPQRYFLVIAGIFGIISVFLFPPFQRPDEVSHFCRVEEISNGQFTAIGSNGRRGGYLPEDLGRILSELNWKEINLDCTKKQDVKRIFKTLSFAPSAAVFTGYANSAWTYPPVLYLPQAIGAVLSKVSRRTMVSFYLSRLFGLFFWILAVYLAIRVTPCFKWGFFMLALLSTNLQQAASVSQDTFINGISFLWFAVILNFSTSRDKTTLAAKDYAVLLTLSLFLCISKAVYSPLVLLLLLIPSERFGSRARYFFFLISIVFIDLIATYSYWHWALSFIKTTAFSAPGAPGIAGKAGFILNNPVIAVKAYLNEVLKKALFSRQFIPGVFGGVVVLMTILAFAANHEGVPPVIGAREKGIILALFFGVTLLIFYVFLSPGSPRVAGSQGRYFIPTGIGIFMLFYSSRLSKWWRGFIKDRVNPNVYFSLVAVVSLIIELSRDLRRFYL